MIIERDITKALIAWKESPKRKPLLLKGVRQCGKTWVLEHLGKTHFRNVVAFNFDKNPDATYGVFWAKNLAARDIDYIR